MGRAALSACVPWLAILAVLFVLAYVLVRLNHGRVRLRRLRRLHADQVGSVQSLSFVITLPLFVIVILLIVQISQLMIGTIVVHYAAYAAARSASVWIPADVQGLERSNCISFYSPDGEAPDQAVPMLDPQDPGYGPAEGGMTFLVAPGSPKYDKIASAAVLACMPISPSRDLGFEVPQGPMLEVMKAAYNSLAPRSAANRTVPKRLENKFAYAAGNTQVEIRFFHKNSEPPLVTYLLEDDPEEFRFNEVGWQDPITVTVKYNFALIPGPGRFLAGWVLGPGGQPQPASPGIRKEDGFYSCTLQASATVGNEGEKSVIPYGYHAY